MTNTGLYSSLVKKNDEEEAKVDQTPEDLENEALIARENDPDTIVEWDQLKTRWDNIGVVYERLIHCSQALNEEESLFDIQQIDNAKQFIAHAKAELEKAFYFECAAVADLTNTPCPFTPSWVENPTEVKSVSREPKFFQQEVKEQEQEQEEKEKVVE